MYPVDPRNRILFKAPLVLSSLFFAPAHGQNLTPGDATGTDHTAYLFSPFYWEHPRAYDSIKNNLTYVAGKSGQRYEWVPYFNSLPPNNLPDACNVESLYDIIHNRQDKLAVLVIQTHGGLSRAIGTNPANPLHDHMAVEPFTKNAAGLQARADRMNVYNDGVTLPWRRPFDILPYDTDTSHSISVTANFFRNHGRLNQSLVYVGTCFGGRFLDDMIAANARVAVGPPGAVPTTLSALQVMLYFKRMDGQVGMAYRTASAARSAGMQIAGAGATTLTPAVSEFLGNPAVPCPMQAGRIVTFTFDTACDTTIIPDIEGIGCTIANETWLDDRHLRGTCTAPPAPTRSFEIILHWQNVKGSRNTARLDGNTDPAGVPEGPNARGPAHDDWRRCYECPAREGGGAVSAVTTTPPALDSLSPLPSETMMGPGPFNNDCDSAMPLPSPPAVLCAESTMGATVDLVPACPPYVAPTGPGVWYMVIGTGSQLTIALNGCGLGAPGCAGAPPAAFDAAINVYEGSCSDLTCVAMDDDQCSQMPPGMMGTYLPRVSWCSVAGRPYYILVHGIADAAGFFQLELTDTGTCPPAPRGACCIGGVCSFSDEADCLAAGGEFQGEESGCVAAYGMTLCYVPAAVFPGDLNCDGFANEQDVPAFVTAVMSPVDFLAQYPGCELANGDLNQDFMLDSRDIALFVSALLP